MFKLFYFIFILFLTTDTQQNLIPKIGSLRNFIRRMPVTIHPGTIGINFLGFRGSASLLGGLLAQNGSPGGPNAEGSTPYGHSGAAGVGVRIDNGTAMLYLYAETQRGTNATGTCVLLHSIRGKTVDRLRWDECASRFNMTRVL